jgi:hypothetical protein
MPKTSSPFKSSSHNLCGGLHKHYKRPSSRKLKKGLRFFKLVEHDLKRKASEIRGDARTIPSTGLAVGWKTSHLVSIPFPFPRYLRKNHILACRRAVNLVFGPNKFFSRFNIKNGSLMITLKIDRGNLASPDTFADFCTKLAPSLKSAPEFSGLDCRPTLADSDTFNGHCWYFEPPFPVNSSEAGSDLMGGDPEVERHLKRLSDLMGVDIEDMRLMYGL